MDGLAVLTAALSHWSLWRIPAGYGPLVVLLILAGLVVLLVEHWPDHRSSTQREVDELLEYERRTRR